MIQIIDADFTMLNARLAKHYGLEGPKSQRFERTSLQGTNRDGRYSWTRLHSFVWIGRCGISSNQPGSLGSRTAPARPTQSHRHRMCPESKKAWQDFEKLSLREQFEFHRKKESCNDCHRTLDPWGIALEEYSAVGLKREKTTVHKKPITSDTILPGNHPVDGVAELQNFILSQRKGPVCTRHLFESPDLRIGQVFNLGR